MTAAVLAVISACTSEAPTQAQVQTQAAGQVQLRAPTAGETALLHAERFDPIFAAVPASAALALASVNTARTTTLGAQRVELSRLAQSIYAEEQIELREAAVARDMVPSNDAQPVRALTALATAHDAVAKLGPWTPSRSAAIDRALLAAPDRQQIIGLTEMMATLRLAREHGLTARRMDWALEQRRDDPDTSVVDLSQRVEDYIASSRQADDAKSSMLVPGSAERDRGQLIEALLRLSSADRTALARWYSSAAGKAARDRLVGSFQGANDRAGRAMVLDYLMPIARD